MVSRGCWAGCGAVPKRTGPRWRPARCAGCPAVLGPTGWLRNSALRASDSARHRPTLRVCRTPVGPALLGATEAPPGSEPPRTCGTTHSGGYLVPSACIERSSDDNDRGCRVTQAPMDRSEKANRPEGAPGRRREAQRPAGSGAPAGRDGGEHCLRPEGPSCAATCRARASQGTRCAAPGVAPARPPDGWPSRPRGSTDPHPRLSPRRSRASIEGFPTTRLQETPP